MKLSVRSRYGLKAMVALAKKNRFCTVKELASEEGISFEYLEKIFSQLSKAKLVEVKHGAQGGYGLNCLPKNISVGDIISVLEGSLSIVACTKNNSCPKSANCCTRPIWMKVEENINSTLNSITLQSLLK